MKKYKALFAVAVMILASPVACVNSQTSNSYESLERLFIEWRQFEKPPMRNGAPDYTKETFTKRYKMYEELRAKLEVINTDQWTPSQRVDWYVVLAEMNGFDFNHRVLKPWERDPAYYKSIWMAQSDVPAHEGPTNHAITEVWQYDFPLDADSQKSFIEDLNTIPPLLNQAQLNLTGNARELWVAGIRDIQQQKIDLERLKELNSVADDADIMVAIEKAIDSTIEFEEWLKAEATSKTGPSGIGKENYTWYQQNVHLVPLTWEDEVMILKRDLARAWSSLKLEENKNRNLPPLDAAASEDEFNKLAEESVNKMMNFLKEQEIVTVAEYFEPTLRDHMMSYTPPEKRNFFTIGAHYSPLPLYSHFYHWWELARMENEPNSSLIRREALLYNIFDSRNEGTATAVEEMFMHAGLYDDNPRGREIVWIMIAQRAARGLGSLYAHANELTMEEAGTIHSEYTPRGWMKTEKDLLLFEQHLYMRQPGYGTSYITGKHLLEDTMAEYARIKELNGEEFVLKEFFDELNRIGNIPIALGRYEMTGLEDQLDLIFEE